MTDNWVHEAVLAIECDFNRSADTHLIKLPLPKLAGVSVYLKDESIHPSGSLKHRLARSLFLYGICNGWIRRGTPIVEASSGSTAISEAYFARLLGLPYHTVIPAGTSQEKVKNIEFLGGTCHPVEGGDLSGHAERLAVELGGHFMDQFTNAERATDWRANNNIAESLFRQMDQEPHPQPAWVVVSAGTGGTSATIGRYIRYKRLPTQLCVADPENSVFYDFYQTGDRTLTCEMPSRIEGIGRPRVEPSFIPTVIERMVKVPDAAAIAALHVLERLLNRKCGGSTGTNFQATMQIAAEMVERGETGSVVTMICDGGERYLDAYYNAEWLAAQGLDPKPHEEWLEEFLESGRPPSQDPLA